MENVTDGEKLEKLKRLIEASNNIVFFGGAGVSTESGIPDFRSDRGLYRQKNEIPPEKLLSHDYFEEHTAQFYDYYRKNFIHPEAKPNRAHYAIAKLEKLGKLKAVITQNVDGLHQAAGSKTVYELHGSIYRNYCEVCRRSYPLDYVTSCGGVPRCVCGGTVKPDVVLYDEQLDERTLEKSIEAIERAELMIVGGTSLAVYPAAGLLRYFEGGSLVIVNKSTTPYDAGADLAISGSVGEILGDIADGM